MKNFNLEQARENYRQSLEILTWFQKVDRKKLKINKSSNAWLKVNILPPS